MRRYTVLRSLPGEDRAYKILWHLIKAHLQKTHRKQRKDALSVTPGVSIMRSKRLSEGMRGFRDLQGMRGLRVSGNTASLAFEYPGVSIGNTTTQNSIATP